MLALIDRYLDGITMYKVVLYSLLGFALVAILLGFFEFLPFKGYQFLLSLVLLISVCYGANALFAKLYNIPSNYESSLITALILFLIFSPIASVSELPAYIFGGVLAMVSKYVLARHRKHMFNPAALSAVLLGLLGSPIVIWWVGSLVMLPVVVFGGFLIVRKIRRFTLLFSFIFSAVLTIVGWGISQGYALSDIIPQLLVSWPLVFFGTVMLTEPLTTPPTNRLRIYYGVLVGILFGSQFHIGILYATPEFALLIGNVYAYTVSSREKLLLHLSEKKMIARDMYAFLFVPKGNFNFVAGQYMEWTLPHSDVDIRGNRRYFTIASSPSEDMIQLGIKVSTQGSSFKKALLAITQRVPLFAGQLAGDFTLPKDTRQKLVFLSGGIGVTPFRSMIKYCVDTNEKQDIIHFFSNKTADEVVYEDVFAQAEKNVGIKTVYTLTDTEHISKEWKGEKGRVDALMIQKYVPDYKERMYYISGPHPMVTAYQQLLKTFGISPTRIIVDYFPGFV